VRQVNSLLEITTRVNERVLFCPHKHSVPMKANSKVWVLCLIPEFPSSYQSDFVLFGWLVVMNAGRYSGSSPLYQSVT
jgi:hypothetical protein